MLTWHCYRNTIVSTIATLDCIQQCDWAVMVDTMTNADVAYSDAVEVLQHLMEHGLVEHQIQGKGPIRNSVVIITKLGRALARDLRAVANRVVGK